MTQYDIRSEFISGPFLRSIWSLDYEAFKDTPAEHDLYHKLKTWSERTDLKETSAEAAFIETFFGAIWKYSQSGHETDEAGFTLHPKFSIKGGGEKGGTGEADLAMGWFDREGVPPIPQVLCEFKDIRSNLDAPQKGRKNPRSPVKQCLDYLSAARRGMFGNEAVLPTWGIVTDMNEFRLYWYDRAPQQYLRFVISPTDLFQGEGLLENTERARFNRFLFGKLFHRDTLLTTGGRALLAQLISRQWVKEREIENEFYQEYRAFRERLYDTLVERNPGFPGTKGRLVRLAQKILDRCIFIFFCEDMGQALSFPPQLLRDFLIHESKDAYFDPEADTIWQRMLSLFQAMNEGKAFGTNRLNQFNGGLFAQDKELESLTVPNTIFCFPGQGQNEASLNTHRQTILYFSAAYNYASGWAQGLRPMPHEDGLTEAEAIKRDPSRGLGLYMLGRIFEQSITELEILEAEADGFLSINKESKRKRDGVYYTPEWVVEKIVFHTLGPRLEDLKRGCGWPKDKLPSKEAVEAYYEKLKTVTVLDLACGSGAFLITALRLLLDEWHALEALRREVTGRKTPHDDAALIRDILRNNLYGVDINTASVEIAQLALWLHTARGDKPLSSLDATIRDGNSLIDDNFYKGQANLQFYDEVQKERVNTFDWQEAFPEVFERGGFDVVISNPPYVKLQNFRKVHADMAEYLKDGTLDAPPYHSTQTGNFDLYLPFIERGIELLNDSGRMGFIAPSLWTVNEYGEGLRELLQGTKQLDRWIDFKAFQVFEEATTYTALQFYSKQPNDAVKVAFSEDGTIPENPWQDEDCALPYDRLEFGDRWLLLTGEERKLIDKLYKRCKRLEDPTHTNNIFVGIQTSADHIYHLKRIAPGKYLCHPQKKGAAPYEVELEDEVMKPLVSGPEAKRYIEPNINTYLLFPYKITQQGVKLLQEKSFETDFPKTWKYLKSYEKDLRARENAKMDDNDCWWAYNYPKNLDKQEIEKLIIPRLVANLACIVDRKGDTYLDNVDVGGVAIADGENPFFIAGIINAPVANFVFRHISKPFRGDYRSANKQFIAPLPIPPATKAERQKVGNHAETLQAHHTQRRDLLAKLAKRMETVQHRSKPEAWLFPTLLTQDALLLQAPGKLEESERKVWAKQRYEEALLARYDEISRRLYPGVTLDATLADGELSFLVDGIPIIDRIFVAKEEGEFLLAQWKVLAQTFSITEKTDGKKLCAALRKLATSANAALMNQVIALEHELTALEAAIAQEEAQLNTLTYELYRLSKKEVELVKK